MSEVELAEEAKEENPSEPLPDIATAAEPGQPAEPEVLPEVPPSQVKNQDSENGSLSIEDFTEETTMVHRSESLSFAKFNKSKFTQTFFKYMKNLTDKRCIDIFNMEVDHEDKSIIFYRRSSEFFNDP